MESEYKGKRMIERKYKKQTQEQLFFIKKVYIQKHRNRKKLNQYFTPEFVIEKAFSLISDPKIENIIDPAVGNGIFLKIATKKWRNAKLFGVDIDKEIIDELKKSNFRNASIVYGNALIQKTWQNYELQNIISKDGFNLVVGNPPFSSWFHRIESKEILCNYELAKNNGKLRRSQAIEILFLEIFIRIARGGGFIVIILPDGILSNPQYKYVREFILKNTKVLHIINLPRNVFDKTSAKTSILILKKTIRNNPHYFTKLYDLEKAGKVNHTLKVESKNFIKRMDYHYYNNLQKSSLQELINNGVKFKQLKNFIVYCKTGKTLYGEEREFSDRGLRFLHATNITEIGINYKRDEKFIAPSSNMNFPNAYAKVGDILFVRVGVGCAGKVAIVNNKEDEGIATDYIHIFRVKNLNPHFLTIYLKTKYGKDYIELLKHGVGTVSINKTDLLSIPIPVVSREIRKEIGDKYEEILREYRFNVLNGRDLSMCKIMTENLIINLEKILQGSSR